MNPSQAVDTGVVNLIGTATVFGQGAIASAISGNPFYSQDPAAANYATTNGFAPAPSAGLGSIGGLLILAAFAYFIFK
jgi:hypothetical protein